MQDSYAAARNCPTVLSRNSDLNIAYDRAAYDMVVDYRIAPVPPMTGQLIEWVNALLCSQGKRPS